MEIVNENLMGIVLMGIVNENFRMKDSIVSESNSSFENAKDV